MGRHTTGDNINAITNMEIFMIKLENQITHRVPNYLIRSTCRDGNRAGRVGLDRANSGLGQSLVGLKLARIFQAKILVAQPALKTELVGPNSLLKAKKIRVGQAGSGHTGPGHIGPGQIWHDFFRANNLMAQPDPNSGWTELAHRAGPILPPLST